MKLTIEIKHVIFITLGFILFTIIGTVSHEFGHVIVAKSLDYDTTLHYGSMNYDDSHFKKRIVKIYTENKTEIEKGSSFQDKAEYEKGVEKLTTDILLVRIGGPLQTIITGVIGLLIIYCRRKKIKEFGLKLLDWLAIFLSLFWLREVFNLIMSVTSEFINPKGSYFGGDEKLISELLNLWSGTVSLVLGVIGFGISVFIVFKIVPKHIRLTFVIAGFIGGISGFILWMHFLGPKILP